MGEESRLSVIPLAGKVASGEEIKRNGGYKEERFIGGLVNGLRSSESPGDREEIGEKEREREIIAG